MRWFLVDITGQMIHYGRNYRQTDTTNMQLDEIDQALIGALRTNARTSVARLGKQLGIARTTVQARIDRLEARGVIAGIPCVWVLQGAQPRAPRHWSQ